MNELQSLIERLEKVEGPDRELDRAIHALEFPCDLFDGPPDDPVYQEPNSPLWFNVPTYTASLDAAVGLSNWILLHASDIGADGLPLVQLGDPSRSPVVEVTGIHQRLVIAWCIAALKARASEES